MLISLTLYHSDQYQQRDNLTREDSDGLTQGEGGREIRQMKLTLDADVESR
jgi:hypothetical protein